MQNAWSIWRRLEQTPLYTYPAWFKLLVLGLYGIQAVLAVYAILAGVYLWQREKKGTRQLTSPRGTNAIFLQKICLNIPLNISRLDVITKKSAPPGGIFAILASKYI